MKELVEEDRRGDQLGSPVDDPNDYLILTARIELEPVEARARCVAFNELPEEIRRTYVFVSGEHGTFADAAEAAGVSEAVVRGRLAQALRVLTTPAGEEQ